jgi:hypothetical protein
MKKLTLTVLLITGFIVNGFGSDLLADKIKFASIDKANKLLTQEDNFTKSWSQFDIDARMHKKKSTREELFNFIEKQTREWTIEEQNKIVSIFKSIDKQIEKQGLRIDFPDEIYFVKTTAHEEGETKGYTRANYIVLKDDILSQAEDGLKRIIAHELFHIMTRSNPEFRKEMYQIIGFHLMNDVAYPENLKTYRITNPDAPQVDSYITIKVGSQSKDCMMILYSNRDYDGENFFRYKNVGFLSLTGDSVKTIEFNNNKPVIYSLEQVTGFFEKVGKNTKYIIHPEEILAENFAFTILDKSELPNQEILNEIRKKLKE